MAATGSLVVKDPQAASWPRGIDYTAYLAKIDASETIASSLWVISGSDAVLTKDTDSIVTGAKKTQIKLSAGTVGVKYTVTNRFTTSSGVIDDRSFTVLIEQQ